MTATVANLCKRNTDVVLRCVDRYSGLFGSKIKSDGRSWAGVTEEMYATRTSGTEPSVPVRSKTGRIFIPGTSPNGNWAKYGLSKSHRGAFTGCPSSSV